MKQEELNNHWYKLAGELLESNHQLQFKTKGYSMFPILMPGDTALIEKKTAYEYRIGDIVVFKSKGILIGHRIVKITKQHDKLVFISRGDNCPVNDQPFTEENVLGVINSFERNFKTLTVNSFSAKIHRFFASRFPQFNYPINNFQFKVSRFSSRILNHFKSIKKNLPTVIESSKKLFLINAVISVIQGLIPFAVIVLIKFLVDFLSHNNLETQQDKWQFGMLLTASALAFALNAVLSEIRTYYSEKLSQSVTKQIYNKLHARHTELSLSNYENPDKQDKIHRAVQEASFRPLKIINSLLNGIKSVASVLFLLGLFVFVRWYLILILTVAILPGILVRVRFSRKNYKLKESHSTVEREMYYYNRILTGFPFAKELKLFAFSDFFLKLFSKTQKKLFKEKLALRKSEMQWAVFTQLFAVLLIFISLGFVSYLKITGEISIGTLVLFFFAFQRGYSVLNDFFRAFTQISEDNIFLQDFTNFLNASDKVDDATHENAKFSLNKEISFRNVSFKYETSNRKALSDINITIPAGKTVALVGANGSGKTTLIKLLCGFYQPDSGQIMFDNQHSAQIGQQAICKNISAVFQDFALYNIPAIENLFLGDSSHAFDIVKAKNAAQAAGIDEVLEKLPQGYNTMLGTLFRNGEELSIGQWQKIAIARAFYRDAPLLVLDEPSSALDAASEAQILEKLKKLSENKTAIIISHRLSSVKWADEIYVFDKGSVVEHGKHDDLLMLKGKYFELFTAGETIYKSN